MNIPLVEILDALKGLMEEARRKAAMSESEGDKGFLAGLQAASDAIRKAVFRKAGEKEEKWG